MEKGNIKKGNIYISKIFQQKGWKDIKGVYKLLYCPGDDKLKYRGSSEAVFDEGSEAVAQPRVQGIIENASKLIETIKFAPSSGGGKKKKSKKRKRKKKRINKTKRKKRRNRKKRTRRK
tara:strand:+ start:78 stop:434 length:357 start_codon:yes stop_codon:yes gene_type:complete